MTKQGDKYKPDKIRTFMTPEEKLFTDIEVCKIEIEEAHEYYYELNYYVKGRPLDADEVKGRKYMLKQMEKEYNDKYMPF